MLLNAMKITYTIWWIWVRFSWKFTEINNSWNRENDHDYTHMLKLTQTQSYIKTYRMFCSAPSIKHLLSPILWILFALKCKSQTTILEKGNGSFSGYDDLIISIHFSLFLDGTLKINYNSMQRKLQSCVLTYLKKCKI